MTSRPPSLAFWIRSGHICINKHDSWCMHERVKKKKLNKCKKWLKKKFNAAIMEISNMERSEYLRCASRIMNGARDQNSSLAINHNGFVVISHRGCDTTNPQTQHHQHHPIKLSLPHLNSLANYVSQTKNGAPFFPFFTLFYSFKAWKERDRG